MIRAYITDVKACLRLSARDSKGRFVKGNKYRFRKVRINGFKGEFLAQSALIGSFFRAI